MGLVAAYMVGRSVILECGTTFHWVYMQNFLSVRLTVEKESKIKQPTERPAAIFVRFVPGLGSSMRKQFTWC